MSLIITVLLPEYVVQVSDMRLTDLDTGQPIEESQKKIVILAGKHARLVLGWVGLACFGAHNTGDWLTEQLVASKAADLNIADIAQVLKEGATAQIANLRIAAGPKRTSFVMAGWYRTREGFAPTLVRISNCEQGSDWTLMREALPKFDVTSLGLSAKRPIRKPHAILVSGREEAADDFDRHFQGLQRLLKRSPEAVQVRNVCVEIMREAAAMPSYGETIGRNLITVEMHRDHGAISTWYHPEDLSNAVEHIPDIITQDAAYKGIEIWSGDTPPDWWK